MKPSQIQLDFNRFHNSTKETDVKLLGVYEQTAKYQDSQVLQFMRERKREQGWTSAELHDHEDFPDMLLTSVRRALNNLMKEGEVYQTGEKRKGSFGMNVLVWQVTVKQQ